MAYAFDISGKDAAGKVRSFVSGGEDTLERTMAKIRLYEAYYMSIGYTDMRQYSSLFEVCNTCKGNRGTYKKSRKNRIFGIWEDCKACAGEGIIGEQLTIQWMPESDEEKARIERTRFDGYMAY